MKSRRNLHQKPKFLRAEASRDTLKLKVSEMAVPGVFNRYFPRRTPFCFVRIHSRLGIMPSNVPGILQHRMVQMFHRSKPV